MGVAGVEISPVTEPVEGRERGCRGWSSLTEVEREVAEKVVAGGRVTRRSFLLESAIIGRSDLWFNCTDNCGKVQVQVKF